MEFTEKDQITHFFGAPIAYLLALKVLQNKEYNLTSMKKWIYGGAPMPSNYLNILRSKFPGEFVGVYGLTEAAPNGLALFNDEHEKHIGTIGRKATINTEFRVVDEVGNDVPLEVEGEIILRTSSLMSGYYNNPEATKEIIKDDWLYTGDIGKVDSEGYLRIIDRKKM
ncbi:AMP-binding protein [Tepidibacillus marianensis]|uniref:AMP-binding protein n=1 Tax=Tepidibacillus marianensis TaxID=3131995 RepID=UPI0030CBB03A